MAAYQDCQPPLMFSGRLPIQHGREVVDGRCSRSQGSLADASRNVSGRTARPSGGIEVARF